MRKIIVTGTSTEVGKTVVSALITEALEADYWKPVQAGSLDHTDTDEVKRLVSNPKSCFHEEIYRFKAPLSPHHAAHLEDIHPNPLKIIPPRVSNALVIEGAGGAMVPLNHCTLISECFLPLDAEWVLVSKNELGSINHTLLTASWLKSQHVNILGIVFNGPRNKMSEDFILQYTQLQHLERLEVLEKLNQETIKKMAKRWKKKLLWNRTKRPFGTPSLKPKRL